MDALGFPSPGPPAAGYLPAPVPCAGDDEVPGCEVVEAVRRMLRFGFHIRAQDIDDIVQDCLVDFLSERRRRATATPGLLVVIARRRAMHYWKRRIRRSAAESAEDIDAVIETYVINGELEADHLHETLALAHAWRTMTERCQSVLTNRFWNEGRIADIALKMGRSTEALKKAVSRCLGRLRLAMEKA